MLDFTFLFNIQTERSTVQLANFEQALNLIDIRIIETKDWFDWDHNLSHLTLYPDVLKKNNNCCETKIFKNAISLLFTNLQIHFWLLCGLDILAAGWPDYGFVK